MIHNQIRELLIIYDNHEPNNKFNGTTVQVREYENYPFHYLQVGKPHPDCRLAKIYCTIVETTPEPITKYNHAFDIAFEVKTTASCETENDYPTPSEVRLALMNKVRNISDDELMEAVGAPFDTYEIEL